MRRKNLFVITIAALILIYVFIQDLIRYQVSHNSYFVGVFIEMVQGAPALSISLWGALVLLLILLGFKKIREKRWLKIFLISLLVLVMLSLVILILYFLGPVMPFIKL